MFVIAAMFESRQQLMERRMKEDFRYVFLYIFINFNQYLIIHI